MAFLPSLKDTQNLHHGGRGLRKVYTFLTALSNVLVGLAASSFTELVFVPGASKASIKYNATGGPGSTPCFEFYLNGTKQGTLDNTGFHAEEQ